mgnify:CR=1 FL=1
MKVKGLFLKEVYAQKFTIIAYSIMFVTFTIAAFLSDVLGPMMLFPCFIASSVGINSFSLDERGWGKYVYSLPCSTKEIILSKYIFALAWNFATLLLMVGARFIGSLVFDFEFMSDEFAFNLVLIFAVYTIMYCLMPLYFKLANKALTAACAAIGGVSGIAVNMLYFNGNIVLNIGAIPVMVSLVVMLISIPVTYHITVKLYDTQELD